MVRGGQSTNMFPTADVALRAEHLADMDPVIYDPVSESS